MSRHADQTGAFSIDPLPGQCQVGICHSFFTAEQHRGQGKAKSLKAAQRKTLIALHYDYAICTVAAGNSAQKRVLEAAGWKRLDSFHNQRSCETTEIWGVTP